MARAGGGSGEARVPLSWIAALAVALLGLPFLVLVVTVSAGVPGLAERFVGYVGAVAFLGLFAVEVVAVGSIFIPGWRDAAVVAVAAFAVLLILLLAAIAVHQAV